MTDTFRPAGPATANHLGALQTVFDASPIGVGVWSVEGELIHANPVLCDLVGRPGQDLAGEVFATFIDPAEEAAILASVEDLWQGARNYFECDLRCRRPDGGEVWLRAHLHAVYAANGRPSYLVSQIFSFVGRPHTGDGVAADAALDDASPALLWRSDESGRVRRGNRAVTDFLGLPRGTTDLPVDLFARVHPDDEIRLRGGVAVAVASDGPLEVTARSRRSDGEWRWLLHRARPVHAADGTFVGHAGTSLDVSDERERLAALEAVARLFTTVTEEGPLAVLRCDPLGRVVYANARWASLLDDPNARLQGLGWRGVIQDEQVEEIVRLAIASVETREPFQMRVRAHDSSIAAGRARPGDEGRYWGELRVAPVFDADDRLDGFVATIADITAQVAAGERADRLARVLDAGSDYLMVVERSGAISYVNHAAAEELGIDVPGGPAKKPTFLMDVLDADSFTFFHEVVEPVLGENLRWKGELTMRHAEGRDIPVSALVLTHPGDNAWSAETVTVVARDISDLKQAQWRMRQLATHDYLTGLPNRVLLYERLDQALTRFHRLGQTVALLYLDLDRFKPINDGLGHHVGDAVLVTLADRIHEAVRDTDTPARIGGDEFAVLVEGYDRELLERVARRLIQTISDPIQVEGVTVQVGVSIGIVSADRCTTDADSLLARGDAAMYEAKAAGRGRYVFAEAVAGGAEPAPTTEPDR